jgi:hypothetical protein
VPVLKIVYFQWLDLVSAFCRAGKKIDRGGKEYAYMASFSVLWLFIRENVPILFDESGI